MNDFPMNEPEQNDPEISDNLHRIVPDDLSPAGLVAGARGKRRRRKGVVGILAALALVAVAVPVALNLPASDNLIAEPAVTSTAPQTDELRRAYALPGAEACYNDDGTPINHSQDASGPAEPGAVKAWLCGDYSPDTGTGFVGPHEPLTSGIDGLLEGVQSEPEVDLAVISCPAEYNLSFNVVFEYEDGTRSIVGGDRHGCRLTYDGGVAREDGEKFYSETMSAWEKQRETDQGDWVVPHICPGPLSLIEMEPTEAVQASVCGEKEDGSWGATYLGEELIAEVTQDLRASYEAHAEDDFVETPEQRVWLTLSDKFTDYQTLVRHEDGRYRAYDGEGLEWFWKPSEELSARLDDAFAAAGTSDEPPAGQPVDPTGTDDPDGSVPTEPGFDPDDDAQPWVSEGCEGITSEDALNSELPNGELPEDADHIWLCAGEEFEDGIVPPVEALEDPGLVSDAVAFFNDLEPLPADAPCTMELGPSWLVVHEYADGTKYVVVQREYGCWKAISGDVVKESNKLYKQELLDLWKQQRYYGPTEQTRPGPLCYLDSSLMTVDPEETTFTSGVACLAEGDDGAWNLLEEKPLPEGLVAQIGDELKKVRPTPDYVIPSGDALVLQNSSGDLLRLFRQADGTYFFNDEAMNPWAPEGEVAEALTELFER